MNRAAPLGTVDYDDELGPDGADGSSGNQLDLQHYVRTVRKYKWPITLFTAAATSLAAYYAFTATPVYSATSTLLIEQQKAAISLDELYGVDTQNTDYYQTQFELLKSPSLAQRVLDRLDLWNHPEFAPAGIASSGAPAAGGEGGEPGGGTPSGDAGEAEEGGGIMDTITGLFDSVEEEESAPASVLLEIDQDAPRLISEGGVEESMPAPPQPQLDFDDVRDDLTREQSIALGKFRSRLSISPVQEDQAREYRLRVRGIRCKAARIANTVGDQYIKSYLDAKLEMTNDGLRTWLQGQLTKLKARSRRGRGAADRRTSATTTWSNLDSGVAASLDDPADPAADERPRPRRAAELNSASSRSTARCSASTGPARSCSSRSRPIAVRPPGPTRQGRPGSPSSASSTSC